MSKIRIVNESAIRWGLDGPAEKALMFTSEPPEAAREAIDALERAHERYTQAAARLREIDDAEKAYHAAVRREIAEAVIADREPREIGAPVDDFEAERRNRRAAADALRERVLAARREADRAIGAAVGAQGAKDAQRLPGLYSEAVEAIQAAQAALGRLTSARRVAVQRLLADDPGASSRPVTGAQVDAAKALTIAEQWLAERKTALTDPVVFGEMVPSRREREAMATDPRYIEQLNTIERAEGFARTDFTRAYRDPSEIGPSGLSRGGAEVTAEDISIGDSGADISGLEKYVV